MDVDGEGEGEPAAKRARSTSKVRVRSQSGLRSIEETEKAESLARLGQRNANRFGRAGESDRHIGEKMPKHLFSGKRKSGKTQRR